MHQEIIQEGWQITYLSAADHFKETTVYFTGPDSYTEAQTWGKENLENFHPDMITIL